MSWRTGTERCCMRGNNGYMQEYAGFPAFNQNVLSVGALKSKGALSGMNPPTGSGIDVYAPGEKNLCPFI